MCELCAPKDELIACLRNLVNSQQDSIIGLVEAFDVAKPHLPETAHPFIDELTAGAKKLAATHV